MERFYVGKVPGNEWMDYGSLYSGSLYNYRNDWVSWIHSPDAPDGSGPQGCLQTLFYAQNLADWFYPWMGYLYKTEGNIGGVELSTVRSTCPGGSELVPDN